MSRKEPTFSAVLSLGARHAWLREGLIVVGLVVAFAVFRALPPPKTPAIEVAAVAPERAKPIHLDMTMRPPPAKPRAAPPPRRPLPQKPRVTEDVTPPVDENRDENVVNDDDPDVDIALPDAMPAMRSTFTSLKSTLGGGMAHSLISGLGAEGSTGRGHGTGARPDDYSWPCEFPNTSHKGIAEVRLSVNVDTRGRALSVNILNTDGREFTAAASACALQQHYRPARDNQGQPIAGPTNVFLVQFVP